MRHILLPLIAALAYLGALVPEATLAFPSNPMPTCEASESGEWVTYRELHPGSEYAPFANWAGGQIFATWVENPVTGKSLLGETPYFFVAPRSGTELTRWNPPGWPTEYRLDGEYETDPGSNAYYPLGNSVPRAALGLREERQ